jgi:ABC-type dipeptide/oligopeptide/nickel transport system permease subunit
MAGLGILAAWVLLSIAIGWVSPYDPVGIVEGARPEGPSGRHWLGTDYGGRDIFTRLCYGARYSLGIGAACVLFSIAAGVPLGSLAGYFGGWTDLAISRLIDLLLSFPSILLAIAIAAPMGASLRTVVIAVGIVGVPQFARQARASVLTLREQEFVTASRALGAGHARILFLDILPNALGPLIVLATLGVGSSILMAAGLSFIGLGVELGTPEWGQMLQDGYRDARLRGTLAVFSGLAISLAVLGFNLFGDGLRDALDPRSRR